MKYWDEVRKINFRFKYKDKHPSPIKVYASLRVPRAKYPKQIHLAYIPERRYISERCKAKIEKKFACEWRKFFLGRFPGIDWRDAERKLGCLDFPDKTLGRGHCTFSKLDFLRQPLSSV